jgi:hypothetical protein
VSGTTLTFGESGDDDILSTPLTTGVPPDAPNGTVVPAGTVIVHNQPSAGQFAADDQNIYWRTSDCKIWKMVK